jgi:hypothetical protein
MGKTMKKKRRAPEVWLRGDYELLSKKQLDECVEVFVAARDIAREVLLADVETLRAKAAAEAQKGGVPLPEGPRPNLFDKE